MGATRHQHFLPQFHLKGFSSKKKEKKVWVYCFWTTGGHKEISTRDIGAERDFHGNPKDSDLEDKMNRVESAFAPHVERWRRGEFTPDNDEELASQFVAHLMVRTQNVREAFAGGSQVVLDDVLERLESGELNPVNNPAGRKQMMEEAAKNPAFALMARRNRRQFQFQMRVAMSEMKVSGEAQRMAEMLAAAARSSINVTETAAKGHIKSLSETQVPEVRVKKLLTLEWSVLKTQPGRVVLGDVGAVARQSGEPLLKHPLVLELDNIELVCCPISGDSVLVGRLGEEVAIPAIEDVNLASAELSRHFLVATRAGEDLLKLQERLGRRAEFMSESELRELLHREVASSPSS